MSLLLKRCIVWVCGLCAGASAIHPEPTAAGTIRHDRNDQLYRSAARNPELDAVVALQVYGQPLCSATLIAPQWVLTATHCIWIPGRMPNFRVQVLINGRRIEIGPENIFINSEFARSGDVLSGIGDIALLRLPEPVTNVNVIPLHTAAGEVGQTGYIAGFGSSGTGRTGNVQRTSIKRVGVNNIDATEARVSFPSRFPYPGTRVGSPKALLTDFDSPQRDASTLGTSEPLNMEYSASQGDSGGPLLLYANRQFTVAGVVSAGIDGFSQTTPFVSHYSSVAIFTRVNSYLSWINAVMRGNVLPLARVMPEISTEMALRGQQFAEQQKMYRENHGVLVYFLTAVEPPAPRITESWAAFDRRPEAPRHTLMRDVEANIHRLRQDRQRDDPPVVELDCPSCGGHKVHE
jgi:secreted trypsin-like serine protease